MRFIVKTLSGLEGVLTEEIRSLGYPQANPLPRGVEVEADASFSYRGNYLLTTALNILSPVTQGELFQAEDLYTQLRQIPWDKYLHISQTFVFKPIIYSKLFPNSHYAILRAKDALADYFRDKTGQRPSGWGAFSGASELGLNVLLVTAVFALIYKTLPRARIAWGDVAVGAAVTALLFLIGKTLIGAYIGRSGITSAFGAAASLIVVLLWVYYSTQIFLFGAEFTWAYSHMLGSRKGQPLPVGATVLPATR